MTSLRMQLNQREEKYLKEQIEKREGKFQIH